MLFQLDRLLTLFSNLLPLAGVLWWGWNIFDVLMLYWMQTLLTVALALLNISKVPDTGFGTITVNGRIRSATRRDFLMIFSLIGVVFCAGHLLFLWVLFSGELGRVVHGPITFWRNMVIASGAWLPLLLHAASGLWRYLVVPPQPGFIRPLLGHLGIRDGAQQRSIDAIFVPLFLRLFVMQAAIIFGGVMSNRYGSLAPLFILIGLKTLIDLGGDRPPAAAATPEIKS